MKQKILFLMFLILLSKHISAQKETNNWFFGYNAGLTWNTTRSYPATGAFGTTPDTTLDDLPTIVTGSPMNTGEGCFSISDQDGNLLFFSDGMTIWNRKMAIMQNGSGMGGHNSSAQSGIVLPYPGFEDKYIAVSLGQLGANNLAYSVVDMNKDRNGGYEDGAVVEKNIYLQGASGVLGESVTTIRHANGEDFWIIAPGRGTTTYLNVWKVTNNGVQLARHSVITLPGTTNAAQICGYINSSPNGKHIAWCCGYECRIYLANFDNSAGMISDVKQRAYLSPMAAYGLLYGLVFSQNGKYMYISSVPYNSGLMASTLSVFDFTNFLNNPATDTPIKSFIFGPSAVNGVNNHFSALAMASDGRIYFGKPHYSDMYVIDNPDDPHNIKVYILSGFLGAQRINGGLPSFAASWYSAIKTVPKLPTCKGHEIQFSLTMNIGKTTNDEVKKIVWNFGDGSPLAEDTDMNQSVFSQKHIYTKSGTYELFASPYNVKNEIITGKMKQLEVTIYNCVMPINPNIHILK